MEELLRTTAERAARYLAGLKDRGVAPTPRAYRRTAHVGQARPCGRDVPPCASASPPGPRQRTMSSVAWKQCFGSRQQTLLLRNDFEVREIAVRAVSHPETDASFATVTPLAHHQTGFFRLIDEHAHVGRRDDNAHMEPAVRIGRGTDGLLVLPRLLGS